jgi:hypothetical protein
MIASKKQRQEHNNFIKIQKAKIKGAHEHSNSLELVKPRTQMQTPIRMDKVVTIMDYNHMTAMNEDVTWMELTHMLSKCSLNIRGPFCIFSFT